jgi:hypothetical protein
LPARATATAEPQSLTPAANCFVNPTATPSPKLRKGCPPCWRGPACARRARSPARGMAASESQRCVSPPFPRWPWHDMPTTPTWKLQRPLMAPTVSGCAIAIPHGRDRKLTALSPQRAASSSSSGSTADSPLRLNIAAVASTAVAAGSIAWYLHLYGPTAHAMTPAEEG